MEQNGKEIQMCMASRPGIPFRTKEAGLRSVLFCTDMTRLAPPWNCLQLCRFSKEGTKDDIGRNYSRHLSFAFISHTMYFKVQVILRGQFCLYCSLLLIQWLIQEIVTDQILTPSFWKINFHPDGLIIHYILLLLLKRGLKKGCLTQLLMTMHIFL